METKTYSQQLADINLLYIQKRITEAERLRRVFEIRAKFETKFENIIDKV